MIDHSILWQGPYDQEEDSHTWYRTDEALHHLQHIDACLRGGEEEEDKE